MQTGTETMFNYDIKDIENIARLIKIANTDEIAHFPQSEQCNVIIQLTHQEKESWLPKINKNNIKHMTHKRLVINQGTTSFNWNGFCYSRKKFEVDGSILFFFSDETSLSLAINIKQISAKFPLTMEEEKVFLAVGGKKTSLEKDNASDDESLSDNPVSCITPIRPVPKSSEAVVKFITSTTTVDSFYDYVTQEETNFDYCMSNRSLTEGYTPLQKACICENIPLVEALLAMGGVNPNQVRDDHYPPLYDAIAADNLELIKILINHGARVDYRVGWDRRRTCLDFAKQRGNQKIITFLTSESLKCQSTIDLSNNLNPKQTLEDKKFAKICEISKAVKKNNYAKVKSLLENDTICIGEYALYDNYCSPRLAAKMGNIVMVRLLTQYCNDPIECNQWVEKTIPQIARNHGHPEIAEFLENTQRERYDRLRAISKKSELTHITKPNSALMTYSLFNRSIDTGNDEDECRLLPDLFNI